MGYIQTLFAQIYGCEKSGLFKAFSEHLLHRLRIPLHVRKSPKIRVTLLSRDTRYRKILNEDELVDALKENPDYRVRKVSEQKVALRLTYYYQNNFIYDSSMILYQHS